MSGEDYGIFGVFDDVDFFAAQFANDGLHAHAFHADARTHAVHVAVAALHRDLGAFAGLARAAADLHRTVVDLGYFLLEQTHDQFGSRARHEHSRAFAGLIH